MNPWLITLPGENAQISKYVLNLIQGCCSFVFHIHYVVLYLRHGFDCLFMCLLPTVLEQDNFIICVTQTTVSAVRDSLQ